MNRHQRFLIAATTVILLFSLIPTLRGEPMFPPVAHPEYIKTILAREIQFDQESQQLRLVVCGLSENGHLVHREQLLPPAHYFVTRQHYWIELEGRYQRKYFYVCYRDRSGEYVLGEFLTIEFYSPFMKPCSSARLDIPWRFDIETQSFNLDFKTGELDPVPPPYQETPARPVQSLRHRQHTEQLIYQAIHGNETARKTLETNGM